MIGEMSLLEAQRITGGELTGADVAFKTVSTDTRTLQKQDLFVALQGPNFNGNKFVQLAAEKNASAALVSEHVATDLPLLRVTDTRLALGKLARHNRLQSRARVVALTGSQGKTTVKEMTSAILNCCGNVLSTKGNLNNDIGVPLTLLQIDADHQYAVIEMGANAANEISYTTQLTLPDVAHITNVAPTHLEGFGSLEGVATAKAEIWAGIRPGGCAVLNIDDENIPSHFVHTGSVRIVSISAKGRHADYQINDYVDLHLAGSHFCLLTPAGAAMINLQLPGKHNAANALAAAALAMEAGAGLEHVVQGLQNMHSIKGRLMVKKGLKDAVVLDDTYNASPSSFRAAIDVLATLPGLRIVVAGDMGELGSGEVAAHAELGAYALEKGINHFFATGKLGQHAVDAFGKTAVHKSNKDELAAAVQALLAPGVHVLVKGSRSAGMEQVVKLLTVAEG
ncbi:MAG: UDP-N-acetylmuramoyl-tripeptide--D-alanyl-D-alanine ligase [Pseudomonadota bacterium]